MSYEEQQPVFGLWWNMFVTSGLYLQWYLLEHSTRFLFCSYFCIFSFTYLIVIPILDSFFSYHHLFVATLVRSFVLSHNHKLFKVTDLVLVICLIILLPSLWFLIPISGVCVISLSWVSLCIWTPMVLPVSFLSLGILIQ